MSNDRSGLATLTKQLSKCQSQHVVIEATGGLEHQALSFLDKKGYTVSVVNPRNVRRIGQGLKFLAKTDRLDAELLARYGHIAKPVATKPRSMLQQRLWANMSRRRQLVQFRAQEKVHLSQASGEIKKDIEASIKQLSKRIKRLENQIHSLIMANDELKKKYRLLTSFKGVGETIATQLLIELPELGQEADKKIAALVGVAPFNRDSGKLRGKRSIWGGRMNIRNHLFVSAMVATKYNPAIKSFYEKLLAKGKPKKVALTACMRKIVISLNHMLKNEEPWREEQSA